jgi:hypothetical protein
MKELISCKQILRMCETVNRSVQWCVILNTSNLAELNGGLAHLILPDAPMERFYLLGYSAV